MGRPSKKARVVRNAAEFDRVRLALSLQPPLIAPTSFVWQLEDIRDARDQQQAGFFRLPAQLAQSIRTDDALFTAYRTRLAPLRHLGVELAPANASAGAARVAAEAEALYGTNGLALSADTIASLHGDLANHGVAFGVLDWRPRDDGSRIDLFVRYWPIEWVRWDRVLRCFTTQVDWSDEALRDAETAAYDVHLGYSRVPIVHGDGRWLIFSKHEHQPWQHEACLLPAALVWAARAFGLRDWAKNSEAHGAAKMFGELPEGVALVDENEAPTKEAAAFLAVLDSVMSGDRLVGLRPSGAKTEFVWNASTNWQIFTELVTNRDRAAARIYLGTDGTLGAQGGAPGVDISVLFGVATTITQGDVECFNKGFFTGLLQPWAAINFGDSTLAPQRLFQLPDPDAARAREETAQRDEQFHAEIDRLARRFELTQEVVDAVAARYGVTAPKLKAAPVATQPAAAPAPSPTNGAAKPANGAAAS